MQDSMYLHDSDVNGVQDLKWKTLFLQIIDHQSVNYIATQLYYIHIKLAVGLLINNYYTLISDVVSQ